MEQFAGELKRLIHGGTFKLMPVALSAVKGEGENGGAVSVLESIKVSVP